MFRRIALVIPKDRVDGFVEDAHAVVALRTGALQPVHGAVESGDKTVSASGDVDDDFAHTA